MMAMDNGSPCQCFESRLGDYLAGALDASARAELEGHLGHCTGCRKLYRIASGDLDLLASEAGRPLAAEILKGTSGPACRRAAGAICDYIDGILPRADSRILSVHLANCPTCSELASTLIELKSELPQMACVWPGAGFPEDVMAATAWRAEASVTRRIKLRRWWASLTHRPRLAWEAAYLVTLLLLVAGGNPALLSMDTFSGKARSAWALAGGKLGNVSSAGFAGAEATAEDLKQRIDRHRASVELSLTGCWNRSREAAAAASSANRSLLAHLASAIRGLLHDFAQNSGMDRTFSSVMRYLDWE